MDAGAACVRTERHVEAAGLELAVLLAERAGPAAPVDAAVGAGLLLEAVLRADLGAVAAGVEAAHPRPRREQQVQRPARAAGFSFVRFPGGGHAWQHTHHQFSDRARPLARRRSIYVVTDEQSRQRWVDLQMASWSTILAILPEVTHEQKNVRQPAARRHRNEPA
jgi:hypothetical protein